MVMATVAFQDQADLGNQETQGHKGEQVIHSGEFVGGQLAQAVMHSIFLLPG